MLVLRIGLALASLAFPQDEGQKLSCQVVASADPSFTDRWNYVESAQFEARGTPSVFRGQRFVFYCFFEGYGLDEQGKADLTYDARITRPDRKPYHESEDHVGWNRAVRDPADVLLAEDYWAASSSRTIRSAPTPSGSA